MFLVSCYCSGPGSKVLVNKVPPTNKQTRKSLIVLFCSLHQFHNFLFKPKKQHGILLNYCSCLDHFTNNYTCKWNNWNPFQTVARYYNMAYRFKAAGVSLCFTMKCLVNSISCGGHSGLSAQGPQQQVAGLFVWQPQSSWWGRWPPRHQLQWSNTEMNQQPSGVGPVLKVQISRYMIRQSCPWITLYRDLCVFTAQSSLDHSKYLYSRLHWRTVKGGGLNNEYHDRDSSIGLTTHTLNVRHWEGTSKAVCKVWSAVSLGSGCCRPLLDTLQWVVMSSHVYFRQSSASLTLP